MHKNVRKNLRFRRFLLNKLPKSVTQTIVKIKGTGILKHPKLQQSSNLNSLSCTIAYNNYGAFCTPNSCLDDEPVQAIYRGEQYEELTIQYVQSLQVTGDIIHAGAYFGDTIPGFSQALSDGATLWAFEPNKESYYCAQITILLNKLSNVSLFNFGIGNETKTVNLLTTDPTNLTKMGGTTRVVSESNANTETVDIRKLDDVIPSSSKVSIIHLDVEGFEEEVLHGALNIISQHKPLIILEVAAEKTELFMDKFGYVMVKGLEERKWEPTYRNAVFKHKDSLLN